MASHGTAFHIAIRSSANSYSFHHHQSLPANERTLNHRKGSCITLPRCWTRRIVRTEARKEAGYKWWRRGDQGSPADRSVSTREEDTGRPRGIAGKVVDAHCSGVMQGPMLEGGGVSQWGSSGRPTGEWTVRRLPAFLHRQTAAASSPRLR